MLRSILCNDSNRYILFNRTITATDTETDAATNNANKKVTFKNCMPFTSFISRIDNKNA